MQLIQPAVNLFTGLPVLAQTAALLVVSNVFMLFAWYSHLRNLSGSPVWVAVLASWSVALLEYAVMVPANRIGFTELSLGQLKILQEVVTLAVFVPFAVFYMKAPLKWDYLWASLCMAGAVYFIFRGD
ncbi:MAG: DMT family protein [Duodenibacillus sp.]|nr:DMT family protein [Duodenibacillus sp.]